MQKKVLIPLLMAPVAFPALADINMEFPTQNDWVQGGATGDQGTGQEGLGSWKTDTDFIGTVGAGTVSTTLESYPAGTYRLNFSARKNIKVTINGAAAELKGSATEGFYVEFKIAGEDAKTTIVIEADDKAEGFSFSGKNLTLVFNAEETVSTLEQQLADLKVIALEQVNTEDGFKEAVALNETKASIEDKLANYNGKAFADVWNAINTIGDETEAVKDQIAIYEEYGFDKAENDIAAYFKALEKEITTYNEDVVNENGVFALYLENLATRTGLLNEANALAETNNNLIAQINGWKVVDEAIKADILADAEAQKEAIENYVKEIEAAYPYAKTEDGKTNWTVCEPMREEIDFTSKNEALTETNAELAKAFDKLQKDYEVYYNVNFVLLAQVENAYTEYIKALNAAMGVRGREAVYDDIVNNGFEKTTPALLSETGAADKLAESKKLQISEVTNATAKYENEALLKKDVTLFVDMTAALNNLVETQNTNMGDAQQKLSEFNAQAENFGWMIVEGSMAEGFKTRLEALQTAIAGFQKYIVDEYEAHTLDLGADGYTTQVGDIQSKLNDLNEYVKPLATVNNLLFKWEQAVAAVQAINNPAEDANATAKDNAKLLNDNDVNIYNKWNTGFENIKTSILALTAADCNNATITGDIESAITNTQANAETMAADYIKAIKTVNGFAKSIEDFNAFVNAKEIKTLQTVIDLKKTTLDKWTSETDGYFTKLMNGYNTSLNNAKLEENGQASWNIITKLIEELPDVLKSATGQTISSIQQQFAYQATQLNEAYAQGELNTFIAALEDAQKANVTNVIKFTFGTATGSVEPLKTELETINNKIVATADNETLGKIDGEIIKFLEKLTGYTQNLNDAKANQSNYDILNNAVNNLGVVLEEVEEYNTNTSLAPADSYYNDVVLPEIAKEISALQTAIDASLQAGTVVKDMAGETGYTAQVQGLIKDLMDTRLAIDNNNTYHNNQLAREKEVRTYIENLIATIEKNENAAGLDIIKGWLTDLNNLLNNDMANANINVTNQYGKGLSKDQNEAIMDEYQRIYDEANEIDLGYNGDEFHQAVVKANAETTEGWELTINNLDNQYRNGIKVYNTFYYDQKNPGWNAYIHETVKRHETLFQVYEEIQVLDQDGQAAFTDWNDKNHVITKADYQRWLDQAEIVSSYITKDVDSLWEDVDTLAKQYYAELEGNAQTAISDAEAALKTAGIDLSYLKPAQDKLALAQKLHKPGVNGHIAESMDATCDELDQVIPLINLQSFAEQAWADKYADALEQFNTISEEIKGYIHAEPEIKEEAAESLANCKENMQILNYEVESIKENLIDSYKENADKLDEYLNALGDLAAQVKQSNDNNVKDQELQDNFDNVWLPNLNSELDKLTDYCNSLGGCAEMGATLNTIENAITLLEEAVKLHAGELATSFGEEGLEGRVNNILEAIAKAYQTAYDQEVEFLRDLVSKTKIAFNDAYQANSTLPEGETFNDLDKQITAQSDGIETLGGEFDAENPTSNQQDLIDHETELCRLYVILQTAYSGTNPATAVLNGLNENYTKLSNAINEGKTTLAGCMEEVQKKFAGQYEALQSELDAAKADWSDDGDRILARQDYYNDAIANIQEALDKLDSDVAAAEEAAQAEKAQREASDAQYAVLYAEYEQLVSELDAAKALVESYGYDISEVLSGYPEYIQTLLDAALAQLEADKAAYSLTAESTLLNAEEIETYINTYKYSAINRLAGIELNQADAARAEASSKLATLSIVPADRDALYAEFYPANHLLYNLNTEFNNNPDADRLAEIAEEAKALAEKFNAISEGAVENSYVLGDVDMDENGEVNVLDVQQLINFVGEGVTYSELYAENPRQACAADIDGNDTINIADVTKLISIILGDDVQVVNVKARKAPVKSNDSMSIALLGEEDGVRTYAVALSNMTAYTAAQFDIKTSGNASVVGVSTVDRSQAHEAYLFDNYDYSRVIIASMENATFAGQDGTLLLIQVEGNGDLTISDAIFTDTDNNIHEISKAHTSTLDAIYDYVKDGVIGIYDAAGRRLQSIKSGINIIRHKDGRVTKEMRK